ncbi:pyridoxamine 5'-phosphate oxidase family protein [Clostridium sp. WILCCON 0269]|uniref:Pyridoxamine 5'-phosphate oxidase family protein n=1 Tax=Candidatus Clostridium eludens TaxID=3381663 RepID=A0ABW8SJ65_9CLOT
MAIDKNFVEEYLANTKYIVLATVDGENAPALRTLGAFGVDGYSIYFSTGEGTIKVKQIEHNSNVSVFFQHENQEVASFINVTIKGKAAKVTGEGEITKAIEVIAKKNPRFKERIKKNGLGNNIIFRVDPSELKILDFNKGQGASGIEVILP